jgi:hypothetical protein
MGSWLELNYFLINVIVDKLGITTTGNFLSGKGQVEKERLVTLVQKLEQPQGISYLERERGDREREV